MYTRHKMVFEMGCDVPVIISNVFFKSSGNFTDTFVYVEAGRKMRVNQLVIYERIAFL